MQVSPFHSLFRGIAVEDLWHDNDECQIALSVAFTERLPGKDHIRKHCQYCNLLNTPLATSSSIFSARLQPAYRITCS
jgi:hypothetical protein